MEEETPPEITEAVEVVEEPKLQYLDMALVVTKMYHNIPILYEFMTREQAYIKAKQLTGEQDGIKVD